MSKCKVLQFSRKVNVTHSDKLAFLLSVPGNELCHEHLIFCIFFIVSQFMDRIKAKKNLCTCHFTQSLKGDLLQYHSSLDKYAIELQLGFCNAMGDNWLGGLLHSTAHSLLEHIYRTKREQLLILPTENELCLFKPKKSTESGNKSKCIERSLGRNFLTAYFMSLEYWWRLKRAKI